ncbi:MAG: YkgJ family cysteine cluster protein [Patescibacteria group bacterium]|nr:YkgJ family cysteine cluster protein [Patescibacteria group bacterium]
MKRVVGSCNGCGACCKVLALPFNGDKITMSQEWTPERTRTFLEIPEPSGVSDDFAYYLKVHGVDRRDGQLVVPVEMGGAGGDFPARLGTYGQTPVVYIRSRCAQLNDDNTCRLHGTSEMPETCRRYPTIHDDLTVVKPECGYEVVDD